MWSCGGCESKGRAHLTVQQNQFTSNVKHSIVGWKNSQRIFGAMSEYALEKFQIHQRTSDKNHFTKTKTTTTITITHSARNMKGPHQYIQNHSFADSRKCISGRVHIFSALVFGNEDLSSVSCSVLIYNFLVFLCFDSDSNIFTGKISKSDQQQFIFGHSVVVFAMIFFGQKVGISSWSNAAGI